MQVKGIQFLFLLLACILAISFTSGYQFSLKVLNQIIYIGFIIILPFFLKSFDIQNKALRISLRSIVIVFILINIFGYSMSMITSEIIPKEVYKREQDSRTYRIYEYRSDLCYFDKGQGHDYAVFKSLKSISFIEKSILETSCDHSTDHSYLWLERYLEEEKPY